MMETHNEPVELPFFRDLYNIRFGGETRSDEAFLLLHGFPAERGNKNVDIAERMSRAFDADAYVIHYAGLGRSRGSFTFEKSIEDSIAYAASLVSGHGYRRLHVIGHSWGGWTAANVYGNLGSARGALALLAPFTSVGPGADDARALARYFLEQHPHIFPADSLDRVSLDLTRARDALNPAAAIARLRPGEADRILVIRARRDDLIPRDAIDAFVAALAASPAASSPAYIEFDSDHRFAADRGRLNETLAAFFARHVGVRP